MVSSLIYFSFSNNYFLLLFFYTNGYLLLLTIKLIPNPINMIGTNILASSPIKSPRVTETPVNVKITKVKTTENINAISEIKHPNTMAIPFP